VKVSLPRVNAGASGKVSLPRVYAGASGSARGAHTFTGCPTWAWFPVGSRLPGASLPLPRARAVPFWPARGKCCRLIVPTDDIHLSPSEPPALSCGGIRIGGQDPASPPQAGAIVASPRECRTLGAHCVRPQPPGNSGITQVHAASRPSSWTQCRRPCRCAAQSIYMTA
jgi:hypothetical protein